MPTAKQASHVSIQDLTLSITEEIRVRASIERTFESLLEQLGPLNEVPEKGPMPMKLEAWPGGRWYRELGNGNGHFWAHVQAIKRPTLLELNGPLFMSYPVSSNLQYRLSEEPGGTLIKFRHLALGLIEEDHRKGVVVGWSTIHARVKAAAESGRSKSTPVQ
ncbi:MAG TPA: SRPBCC domain-containing protein [Candidatus Dormibacteraeota bacterium]|jgi:hypothetical protein|nr:SRPBCC domain-containing protein [Candidatus Dormibacteraeota bacterium]